MKKPEAQINSVSWWAAGILLGLAQILAISLSQSPDISHQFIAANTDLLKSSAPEYINNHPLMQNEDFRKSNHGWWLIIGILIGAFIAAIWLGIWKIRTTSDLWQQNHNTPIVVRMIAGFFGGALMLLGAAIAYGGMSGNVITGLSELSLSAIPFSIAILIAALLVTRFIYPSVNRKNNQVR